MQRKIDICSELQRCLSHQLANREECMLGGVTIAQNRPMQLTVGNAAAAGLG